MHQGNSEFELDLGIKQEQEGVETTPLPAASPETGLPNPEVHQDRSEAAMRPLPPLPADPQPTVPLPLTSASPLSADDQTASSGPKDIIEPEWIQSIHDIRKRTVDDPRRQKEEMSRLSAEFIKQNYNKSVRTRTDSDNP